MESINLTNTLAGLAAIQRAMAGEDILFTRLEIGDGVLTDTDVSKMTRLINKTKDYVLGAVDAEDSEIVRLRSNLSNDGVTQDLIIREYGIYAKFGNEQEFLFAYLNTGNVTTPLPSERIGRYELNRDFVLYIGNSLHVDFTSNGHLIYVSVNQYKDDMKGKANVVGTIEELKASKKYAVGDIVQVLGIDKKGDGGNHLRKVDANDDGSGILLLNGLYANTVEKEAIVVFTFDDNKKEDDDVYNLFEELNIPCTFGVITSNIFTNSANFLDRLFKYKKNGFEITSHSFKHIKTDDKDIARSEYENSRDLLNCLGFESRGLILPYSVIDENVLDIAKNKYDFLMIGGSGIHKKYELPKDKKISRVHITAHTLEQNKDLIKKAMQENLLIVFYAHQTDKGAEFEEFVRWVATQNIKIKTASDAVKDFYQEFYNSGQVMQQESSFFDVTKEQNSKELSYTNNIDFIRMQDHTSTGMTIHGRVVRIPAVEASGRMLTIQLMLDISNSTTYKIEPKFKFSNSQFSKFNITLEKRLYNNDTLVKEFDPLLITDQHNIMYTNDIDYITTSGYNANKLMVTIRFLTIAELTASIDLEVEELKVSDLKRTKENTLISDTIEHSVSSSALTTGSNAEEHPGSKMIAFTNSSNIIGISQGRASSIPDSYWFQLGYRPGTKKMMYRYYDVGISGLSEWTNLQNETLTTLKDLDTPYYTQKMIEEGVYEEFKGYMDTKHEYDYQQREIEKQKQLAYEEELKENPNLTYEEFLENLPMMLPVLEELQPSEALIVFKEKYLG
ncbi:MAG: polysaccharide deacetylase family protein [Clostridium butyricum]